MSTPQKNDDTNFLTSSIVYTKLSNRTMNYLIKDARMLPEGDRKIPAGQI
jgi:hypothetical protein